jgi:serine/threonine-protein kinase
MTQAIFHIVGTTIGGTYEVEKAVAEGGFGVLYRAYHGAFRAPVALKCLKVPASVGENDHAELLERFRKEAEVMFRLSASIPTVVRPMHVDALTTDEGVFVPYMVLEWLEGETLDALIIRRAHEGRPALGLKKLVQLLTPIARALERAHKFPSDDGFVSISHCDLKPENVFLADFHGETVAKILDFGIAKVRQATAQMIGRQSQTGELSAFSPCYAAPEQWLPKRFGAAGPWTDIWGLALTLVEAAAGRQIMSNDFQAAIGSAIDEKRRPTPRNEGVEVSDSIERAFERALAVDPRNRHPNMAAFWNELEDAVGVERSRSASQGVEVASVGSLRSSIPPAGSSPPPPSLRPAPTLLETDAPDLEFAPARAPAAVHVRGAQAAAALQLEPLPSPEVRRAKDPASGPQQRVADLGRPATFPELLVPGKGVAPVIEAEPVSREAPTDAARSRERGFQQSRLLEAPADSRGAPSLELEDVSPPSRRGGRQAPEPAPVSQRAHVGASPAPARKSLEGSRGGATVPDNAAPRARPGSGSSEPRSPVRAFAVPVVLILLGVVVAAVDGGQNQVGGVQLNWIAGGVAGIGILLALWRLFAE